MYKIKGKDSNGNKFKIKSISINGIYTDIYSLSYIKADGTESSAAFSSRYIALSKVIENADDAGSITLKVKIKGSDKRIEVVGGTIKSDIPLSAVYRIFIDGTPTVDIYDNAIALVVALGGLISDINLKVESDKLDASSPTDRCNKILQYYSIPGNKPNRVVYCARL